MPTSAPINGTPGSDRLTGTAGADRIFGLGGSDFLYGRGGLDFLDGGDGNDLLDGGAGDDEMAGGAGNDAYCVDSAADVLRETLAGARGGTDTVHASVDFTLGANFENLFLYGLAAIGTGNTLANTLTGNGGDNSLFGRQGNDRLFGKEGADLLDGGAGADRMEGGTGDDTYFIDNLGDSVIESPGSGLDTVKSSVDLTLGGNFEALQLAGAARQGTGNALGNTLTGNGNDNTLRGLGGDDTLEGGDGADLLDGGTGSDWAVYRFETTSHWNNYDVQSVRVFLSNGSVTFPAGSRPEHQLISIENIETGDGNDVIYGSSSNNILRVGNGANRVEGGEGNDTIYGGSRAYSYDFNDGSDVLPEILNGGSGDDVIYSGGNYYEDDYFNYGVDQLNGGIGNDKLHAGLGIMELTGGSGDDHFVFADDYNYASGGHYAVGIEGTILDYERFSDKVVIDLYDAEMIPNFVGENDAIFTTSYDYDEGSSDLPQGLGFRRFGDDLEIRYILGYEEWSGRYDTVAMDITLKDYAGTVSESDFLFI